MFAKFGAGRIEIVGRLCCTILLIGEIVITLKISLSNYGSYLTASIDHGVNGEILNEFNH